MAWCGEARRGRRGRHRAARRGVARPGIAGEAGIGLVWRCAAGRGQAGDARRGGAGLGWVRLDVAGEARRGKATHGEHWHGRLGTARHGPIWQAVARRAELWAVVGATSLYHGRMNHPALAPHPLIDAPAEANRPGTMDQAAQAAITQNKPRPDVLEHDLTVRPNGRERLFDGVRRRIVLDCAYPFLRLPVVLPFLRVGLWLRLEVHVPVPLVVGTQFGFQVADALLDLAPVLADAPALVTTAHD